MPGWLSSKAWRGGDPRPPDRQRSCPDRLARGQQPSPGAPLACMTRSRQRASASAWLLGLTALTAAASSPASPRFSPRFSTSSKVEKGTWGRSGGAGWQAAEGAVRRAGNAVHPQASTLVLPFSQRPSAFPPAPPHRDRGGQRDPVGQATAQARQVLGLGAHHLRWRRWAGMRRGGVVGAAGDERRRRARAAVRAAVQLGRRCRRRHSIPSQEPAVRTSLAKPSMPTTHLPLQRGILTLMGRRPAPLPLALSAPRRGGGQRPASRVGRGRGQQAGFGHLQAAPRRHNTAQARAGASASRAPARTARVRRPVGVVGLAPVDAARRGGLQRHLRCSRGAIGQAVLDPEPALTGCLLVRTLPQLRQLFQPSCASSALDLPPAQPSAAHLAPRQLLHRLQLPAVEAGGKQDVHVAGTHAQVGQHVARVAAAGAGRGRAAGARTLVRERWRGTSRAGVLTADMRPLGCSRPSPSSVPPAAAHLMTPTTPTGTSSSPLTWRTSSTVGWSYTCEWLRWVGLGWLGDA